MTCDNVVTLRPREDAPPRRNFASMQVRRQCRSGEYLLVRLLSVG